MSKESEAALLKKMGSFLPRSYGLLSSTSDERTNLPRKGPITFTAHFCSQRRVEACGISFAVGRETSLGNDILTTSAASPSTRSLKSTAMPQLRWQPFASGRTHSSPSTASRRISFPSSLPTSPPRRTVSTPLPCVAIGVESSSNMAHYGHNFFSEKARSVCRPSSDAQKALR